jgi:hypothetical protein
MKERPIVFSAPMVRAILDGSKTQTRRVVKDLQGADYNDFASWNRPTHVLDAARKHGRFGFSGRIYGDGTIGSPFSIPCPYGQPGDRLWVRETWRGLVEISEPNAIKPEYGIARYVPDQKHCRRVDYAATQERDDEPWRPSIHMPRWASRILLEIVSVRVERLHAITLGDICKEGLARSIYDFKPATAGFGAFADLWQSINGAGSWDANPWVWVVEFKRVAPC